MNNNLQALQRKKVLTLDSREVAEMVGKNHADLLRDIRRYQEYLTESNFALSDFFVESNYKDITGRELKCYQVTKKGCEFIAHKLTGKKGAIFTATYINRFHEMEHQLSASIQELSPQLQLLINMELKQKEMEMAITENKQEIQDMRDVIKLDTTSWRKDTANLVNKIALKIGGFDHIKDVREESYKLLNQRMGVSLETRLTNKRRRMAEEGVSKSRRDKLNYLDIIAEDKKLIEGYVAIVKEMAIKYKIA